MGSATVLPDVLCLIAFTQITAGNGAASTCADTIAPDRREQRATGLAAIAPTRMVSCACSPTLRTKVHVLERKHGYRSIRAQIPAHVLCAGCPHPVSRSDGNPRHPN